MAKDVVDKGERIKLLNTLLEEDNNVYLGDAITQRPPEWYRLEKAKILPPGSAQSLINFHGLPFKDQSSLFAADPSLPAALVAALKVEGDQHSIKYSLTKLYDILRDDTSRYAAFVDAIHDEDAFSPFLSLLEKQNDTYVSDKAAFLLSGLISRSKPGMFSDNQIAYFVHKLVKGEFHLSNSGRLVALSNILKLNSLRDQVWNTRGFIELLKKSIAAKSSASDLYYCCFCIWLLTFEERFVQHLLECGLLVTVCRLLKECKTEKVVRLSTRTLINALKCPEAVEMCIEENIVQVLTLLEYEKWRDDDTYEEIQESSETLQSKIRLLSNFDRYKREVETGSLKWSYLHSEKFWHENVMHFEENEFQVVKQLVSLLKNQNSSNVTLEVACYDVGEFARLHPTGKRMIQRLQVKAVVMLLMSHQSREVCREALLCTQKLMLDKWQDAAAGNA